VATGGKSVKLKNGINMELRNSGIPRLDIERIKKRI
jgi:hypothetical protein